MAGTFQPIVNHRTPSRTRFAELFLAAGPQMLNEPGDNTYHALFGRNWLVVADRLDGLVRLFTEEVTGEWTERTVPGHPIIGHAFPGGARRFSLAFDQAANPVVAFEQAGTVKVTRWDPVLGQYVQNVSFAGVDPVLVMDASWTLAVPDSDVLLFYLSSDRERVMARVQREVYGVEHEMHVYAEPVILDRVAALPYRYQLLVSDASGAALPGLLSERYPVGVGDALIASGAGPVAGDYRSVVIPHSAGDALAVLGAGPTGGSYADPVIIYEADADALAALGIGPASGDYAPAIIAYTADPDELEVIGAAPDSGEYRLVVINAFPDSDVLDVTGAGPSGGVYEAA